ncbi:MAG: alpha/beta hydrolase [Clostridia bacterium]|nr:alpha/beta hydrolase [Clostridia bacterium]
MHWYWIVPIALAAVLLIALGIAGCMFYYAFAANRKAIEKVFREREQDPAPLVRMRYRTKEYFDALPFDALTLTAKDGVNLSARFFPNGGTKKVAILCHGWHSYPWWDFGKAFDIVYDAGCAVLAVFQRAQGESEGRYLTYGAKESEDLLGWIDLLLARYGEDLSIALMGVSMGAATVLCATGKPLPKQVKCAVSDCAFTSAKDQFKAASKGRFPLSRLLGQPIAELFAHMRYRDASPIDAVKRSKTPTLFVHGDADAFVPYAMMQELFDACAASDKATWTSPGAVHAEAAMQNPDEYAAHVLPWLSAHL